MFPPNCPKCHSPLPENKWIGLLRPVRPDRYVRRAGCWRCDWEVEEQFFYGGFQTLADVVEVPETPAERSVRLQGSYTF